MSVQYLESFDENEKAIAKALLANQVVRMLGRKFEEGDWSAVYCRAKNIPETDWSNLHIDINHNGLGVEHKMKCEAPRRSLLEVCGTTLMHPSATRSIRVASTEVDANEAMVDVLTQYAELIEVRTEKVRMGAPSGEADMRTGWLIWERSLTEFIYFEERMAAPDPANFYAEWNKRESKGVRKSSKNLWIYDKSTGKKRYSITTNAGAKIQPYFDVPPPGSPALNYFKVQGEELVSGRVLIWISASSARELHNLLGADLSADTLSDAILRSSIYFDAHERDNQAAADLATFVEITREAYNVLVETWGGVSDEHRTQLFIQTLRRL